VRKIFATATLFLCASLASAGADEMRTDVYHTLSTQFRGPGMKLDVFNGGPRNNQVHLVPCGNYSGQNWLLSQSNGWYRLTTQFRGTGACLDIFNGGEDNNQPHLTDCANYSGQFWKIYPTQAKVN
jgi:hypothetical protein